MLVRRGEKIREEEGRARNASLLRAPSNDIGPRGLVIAEVCSCKLSEECKGLRLVLPLERSELELRTGAPNRRAWFVQNRSKGHGKKYLPS